PHIHTLALHDALPIWPARRHGSAAAVLGRGRPELCQHAVRAVDPAGVAASGFALAVALAARQSGRRAQAAAFEWRAGRPVGGELDRKSTRLNSSHVAI